MLLKPESYSRIGVNECAEVLTTEAKSVMFAANGFCKPVSLASNVYFEQPGAVS